MNGPRSAEDRIAAWLEAEATGLLPDRVLEASFERTRGIRQARRSAWRAFPMTRPVLTWVSVGAAAIVIGVAVAYFRPAPSSNVGGLPPSPPPASASPSTSPNPSAELDISAWKTYDSVQYGITIGRPKDWSVYHQATRPWTVTDTPIDLRTDPYDTFTTPSQNLAVGTFAVPLEGVVVDTFDEQIAWAAEFCRLTSEDRCEAIGERAEPFCLDQLGGICGVIVSNVEDVHAYIAVGQKTSMTVVVVWRPEGHEATQRYGGSTRLLRAFLATLNVLPE